VPLKATMGTSTARFRNRLTLSMATGAGC
jgi:hypothetical protein